MDGLKIGQLWKDNYPYSNGHERVVEILELDLNAKKARVAMIPGSIPGMYGPKRWTKTSRFNGKASGFSLVKDAEES